MFITQKDPAIEFGFDDTAEAEALCAFALSCSYGPVDCRFFPNSESNFRYTLVQTSDAFVIWLPLGKTLAEAQKKLYMMAPSFVHQFSDGEIDEDEYDTLADAHYAHLEEVFGWGCEADESLVQQDLETELRTLGLKSNTTPFLNRTH